VRKDKVKKDKVKRIKDKVGGTSGFFSER